LKRARRSRKKGQNRGRGAGSARASTQGGWRVLGREPQPRHDLDARRAVREGAVDLRDQRDATRERGRQVAREALPQPLEVCAVVLVAPRLGRDRGCLPIDRLCAIFGAVVVAARAVVRVDEFAARVDAMGLRDEVQAGQ